MDLKERSRPDEHDDVNVAQAKASGVTGMTPQPRSRRGQRVAAWCPLCGTEGWEERNGRPMCDNPTCDVATFRYSRYTQTPPNERADVYAKVVKR